MSTMWAAQAGIGLVLMLSPPGATPSTADEICANAGATEKFNEMRICVSSVRAPEQGATFGPENLVKVNPAKAWCAGAPDYGIGSMITIQIEGGVAFRRLLVSNGHGSSPEAYADNARVRTVQVTGDGGLDATLIFPDRRDIVPVDLPTMAHDRISLQIVDVYPGQRNPNACLSYVTPDFEYEEELLMRQQGLIK